jgi:hypothetical protein
MNILLDKRVSIAGDDERIVVEEQASAKEPIESQFDDKEQTFNQEDSSQDNSNN